MKPHMFQLTGLKKTDASDSERMKLTGFRVEENHCLVYHRTSFFFLRELYTDVVDVHHGNS